MSEVTAWITAAPWSDTYALRLGQRSPGGRAFVATAIDDRRIVWTKVEDGVPVEPLLELRREEVEALSRGINDTMDPETAIVAHLKDAIVVRDRLLTMIEGERSR